MDALVFDSLALAEIPVKLAGKDYVLIELTEEGHSAYRNYIASLTALAEDGVPKSAPQLWAADAFLLSLCMHHEAVVNGEAKVPRLLVSLDFVRGLRRSISGPLIAKCEEMNRLGRFNPEVIEAQKKLDDEARKRAEDLRAGREQEAKN